MERHIDEDLDNVRQSLLRMGAEVEEMVVDSLRSLVERDDALARDVVERDKGVDLLEKSVDEACHRVLAIRQPTAVDLRFLVAVMKITNDLERVGDSAVNIAESVEKLHEEPPLERYTELSALAHLVGQMLRDAMDALINRDTGLAIEVCRRDDQIDARYGKLFRGLETRMIEDPESVSRALHLLLIARNLERIGDHATNVAEDVIYYVEGRDMRHEGADPDESS